MCKNLKYALLTCTVNYSIAAVLLFLFGVSQTGFRRIDSDAGQFIVDGLTLALSEFQWWGDYWYLAVLVPWLGSLLILTLMMAWSNSVRGHRRLLAGISISAYYLVLFLVFIINGLISGWGDIAYPMLVLWPIIGFGLGYLSAIISDKIVKFRV
jgi:hypothetical protein